MNGKAQDYTPSLLLKKKITIFATGNHAVIVMEKDYKTKDIIEYIVAIISDFAERYKLTDRQAYRYLKFHGAIPFLKDYYGIIHTLDFNEAVESVAQYCRREGGKL